MIGILNSLSGIGVLGFNMKVSVSVKPGSKFEKIEEDMNGKLKVWLKEPAKDGLANNRLIKVLASYYNTHRANVSIKHGLSSRDKVVEVAEGN